MANCCSFEINLKAQTTEQADRVVAILQNRDPEYCIIRGWPDEVYEYGKGAERTIEGGCPWTADYMWDPQATLYGAGLVPGETVLSDGRILVSIPWLCREWGMSARGWELEENLEISGWYSCGPDGVLSYYNDWKEHVEEMAMNNPDDEYWAEALEKLQEEEGDE